MSTDNETKSRRDFLNRSVVAGSAALAAAQKASAASAPEPKPIQIAGAFTNAQNTALRPANFPMRGAQVFAKVCKDEGLAALFCCPGNYEVINSIVEEGIPAFGGRNEGAMCSAADAFCRVTGEVAATSGTEGPGFTNMIMNIAAANAARSPVLVLA